MCFNCDVEAGELEARSTYVFLFPKSHRTNRTRASGTLPPHTHTESHCVKPLTFDPRAATRRSRRGSAHRPCAAATTRQPVQIAKGHEATAKHSSSAEAIGSRPWQLMNLAQCVSPHHSKAVAPTTSARRGDAQPHATKPLRAFSTTPTTPCSPHKQTPRAPCCGLVLAACTRLAMPAPPTHLP